jgi:LysR family hydrogen peroxide-inducible transcriptional activator
MVKKLEEELDIEIFDRKSSPITTTDSGKELIEEAKKVLHHAHSLKDISKAIKNKVEGKAKIGIIPTVACALLPKTLKILLSKYPLLELEIIEITSQNMIKQLKEGNLDMGILATPLNNEEIEENILYYEALMIYGNLEQDKKYILPEELKEYTVWLLEEGHCLREQMMQLCHLKKKTNLPKNLKFEANSFETLLNLVDEFGGLTLIPELYYQTLPAEKKQKVAQFQSPIPVREISLVYFRPFAKYRIIEALANDIKGIVNEALISNTYKKSELSIIKI